MSTIAARLKRAEEMAGKVARCAWCRLSLRETGPGSPEREESSVTPRVCEECGTEYTTSIPAGDDMLSRVARVLATAPLDAPYTDAAAHAAEIWVVYRGFRSGLPEAEARFERARRRTARLRTKEAEQTPGQKLKAALLEEARAILERRDRLKVARYGRRFPELDALKKSLKFAFFREPRGGYFERERVSYEQIVEGWRAWSILETSIFGEPDASTSAKVAEYEHRAEEAARERAEQEAERERAEAAAAEARQRREADRARQQGAVEPADGRSDFWGDSSDDTRGQWPTPEASPPSRFRTSGQVTRASGVVWTPGERS